MTDKVFVDSNVWLYAFMDQTSPKHASAIQLINQPNVLLSTQVINEVCANLIRKADYSEQEIRQTLNSFAERYTILDVGFNVIQLASNLRDAYSLSYWDSLILATAQEAKCSTIYSEDMHNGLKIGSMSIRNPFKN